MQASAFEQALHCVWADWERFVPAVWALPGKSMHGAGSAWQSCRQPPENVINYWLLCFVMLEELNVPNDISSLGTTNWWEHNAWSGWPVAICSMTHLLPQLHISAKVQSQICDMKTPGDSQGSRCQMLTVYCLLVEVLLLCPQPAYQNNQRLLGIGGL